MLLFLPFGKATWSTLYHFCSLKDRGAKKGWVNQLIDQSILHSCGFEIFNLYFHSFEKKIKGNAPSRVPSPSLETEKDKNWR